MVDGINYWSLPQGENRPFPLALDDARRAGFQALETVISLTGALTVDSSQSVCENFRNLAAASGLDVSSVATGLAWAASPTHPDPAIRQRARDLQLKALHRAAWLGATSFLLVPGAVTIPWDPTYPPVPYDSALLWAAELLSELLPTADKLHIDICIENVWNGLLYSPLEFRSFIDQFNSPRLGVYLDLGNLLGLHQHPPHWVHLLAHRIKRVHVKDFKRAVGGLNGFCKLGEGDLPFAESIAALQKIGYHSTVIAEVEAGTDEALAQVHNVLHNHLHP